MDVNYYLHVPTAFDSRTCWIQGSMDPKAVLDTIVKVETANFTVRMLTLVVSLVDGHFTELSRL